ncbi:MAG: IS200/IS605 family transposase [Candidatus Korobacteraceae bacterium]
MAHTYNINYVHCVFSTKRRLPLIAEPEKVWATIHEVARASKIKALAVGGMADHAHVLISIPSTRTVSEVMRELKCNSSLRIRKWNRVFSWQDGYGSISVSPSAIASVKRYIERQKAHHAGRSFEEEYTSMLERAGVTYDPEYLFD